MNLYPVKKVLKSSVDFELSLPGSKSITNRCFIISALAGQKVFLKNVLFSDDTFYMIEVLKQLGIKIKVDQEKREVEVEGGILPEGKWEFFVGNAGTTMRFLTTYLSLGKGEFILDGDERMRQRPIQALVDVLRMMGVEIFCVNNNGCPPVKINASGVEGGEAFLNSKNSSQYLSSILMSSPYFRKGVCISIEEEMVSRPYVEMTVRMMKQFGVDVKNSNYLKFEVLPSRYVSPGVYYIEPDASSASYFLAATAILTGRVKIHGLGKESLQGDVYFARIMEKIGCEINIEKDFIELISNGKLEGIDIDMNSTPDLVPTVAIVALFARTPTRIRNVANLRIKESDRISALANELSKIGAKVKEYEDGLEIFPSLSYNNACVSTYNDHRIAMAFTIAGLKTGGITIENPLCVSKSFPEFFDYVEKIFY